MTTPQPAALPEPFAWAWHNKVTGAKGVYFEDPQPFGVTSHPDYEWTRLYNESQVIAALQSQPAAAVSDEEIERIFKKCGGKPNGDHWVIEDADLHPAIREFLSLRPQSSRPVIDVDQIINSMGWGIHPQDMPEMRMLCGKVVEAHHGPLALRPQAVPMTEVELIDAQSHYIRSRPMFADTKSFADGIRYAEAHHNITAQGAQGEQA